MFLAARIGSPGTTLLRVRPASFLITTTALLITTTAPVTAQVRVNLGAGVGTVRFPPPTDSSASTTFSSALFSPGLQYTSSNLVVDLSGSFASLGSGDWSSQGRADVWVASKALFNGWRFGAEAVVAGMSQTDSGSASTGAAHGIAELLWSRPNWGMGIGAGPSSGWIQKDVPINALHSRARAWWRPGGAWRTEWQLSLEPTWFANAWFTDATAAVTIERGPVIGSLWAAGRLSSAYGSKGAGSAFVQFFVTPRLALELAGGSYLPDPYQGLPRAGFVTFSVRLHGTPHLSVTGGSRAPKWTPLIPESRGDSLVVRFRFDSVKSVAIAGDWNEWRPIPLRPLGDNLWEGMLVLPRGLHHFNLLVDGNDWVVPNGVAAVADGLGGIVGVLLVP
jgi:hypothetical protein